MGEGEGEGEGVGESEGVGEGEGEDEGAQAVRKVRLMRYNTCFAFCLSMHFTQSKMSEFERFNSCNFLSLHIITTEEKANV